MHAPENSISRVVIDLVSQCDTMEQTFMDSFQRVAKWSHAKTIPI